MWQCLLESYERLIIKRYTATRPGNIPTRKRPDAMQRININRWITHISWKAPPGQPDNLEDHTEDGNGGHEAIVPACWHHTVVLATMCDPYGPAIAAIRAEKDNNVRRRGSTLDYGALPTEESTMCSYQSAVPLLAGNTVTVPEGQFFPIDLTFYMRYDRGNIELLLSAALTYTVDNILSFRLSSSHGVSAHRHERTTE
jgi:hypothetical protein